MSLNLYLMLKKTRSVVDINKPRAICSKTKQERKLRRFLYEIQFLLAINILISHQVMKHDS